MGKNYVLFLVYNLPEVYTECHFHLLRYLATRDKHDEEQIAYLIYADQPLQFDRWKNSDIDLQVVPISLEQVQSWYGARQYLWRAKIVAIKDALQRTGGNVLYCDTDTYPRRHLGPLFRLLEAGQLFMYELEGTIDKRLHPYFHMYDDWFSKHPKVTVGPRIYEIPLTSAVWNAGVVGIGHSEASIIDEALAFSDALYSEWSFSLVEQFSLGYIFQNSPGGCAAAADYICHYWPLRRYVLLLNGLFAMYGVSDIDSLVRASQRILPEDLLPLEKAWRKSRPFQFLWRSYPYGHYIMSRILKRDWPIEKEISRLYRED